MAGSVVTYVDNENKLRPLIIMLEDFLTRPGSPYPIPEIVYQNQMSETGTIPGEKFYPHTMIKHTMNAHASFTELVWYDPSVRKRFLCFYWDKDQMRMHEFSNTMPLYADIITLQYLYVLRGRHGEFPRRICQLAQLMIDKYMIYEDTYCEKCEIDYEINCENMTCFTNDPKKVTFERIVKSYLSVMLWVYHYVSEIAELVRNVFPYSNLPAMICSPFFALVLPRRIGLDDKYLAAVNMAISAAYELSVPILTIYHHLLRLCTASFDVYTEDVRIDICIKLGIVIKRNGKYFFAPYLEKHRSYYVIAKNKIRSIRQDDETLDETFEQINQLFS